MKIRLREIEEAARAASKGEWRVRALGNGECFVEAIGTGHAMAYGLEVLGDDYTGFGDDEQRARDVTFVASLQPSAALALIEVVRKAKVLSDFQHSPPDRTAANLAALRTALEPFSDE